MGEIPDKMRAIVVQSAGPPDVLKVREQPVPVAGDDEILIRVAAAGVNRPDVLQRLGLYPPPRGAPDILGLELAGTVAACGRNVHHLAPGDQICALVPGGGYGEYCVAPAAQALPLPQGLSVIEAAALPETTFTVWHNVFERGRLMTGETFLVHGGTSGIGTTAIQLAALRGARVIATAGSDEKCTLCRALGAECAVNYNTHDFVDVVKGHTNGKGADVILDMVGGDTIERNYKAASVDGRIVQIAFLAGARVKVDFSRLMLKRLTHTGSTLRARSIAFKAALARAVHEHVWPALERGAMRPIIDSTYTLEQAAAAHTRMESRQHMGKIVLTLEHS